MLATIGICHVQSQLNLYETHHMATAGETVEPIHALAALNPSILTILSLLNATFAEL